MKKFTYTIGEQDLFDWQMYEASRSKHASKRRRNRWIVISLLLALLTGMSFLTNRTVLGIYFGSMTLLSALFYPRWQRWLHIRHYRKHIREAYAKRIGTEEHIALDSEYLSTQNESGEGKIKLEAIDRVDETERHFFIYLQAGGAIIVPKSGIETPDELRAGLQDRGIMVHHELDWEKRW